MFIELFAQFKIYFLFEFIDESCTRRKKNQFLKVNSRKRWTIAEQRLIFIRTTGVCWSFRRTIFPKLRLRLEY